MASQAKEKTSPKGDVLRTKLVWKTLLATYTSNRQIQMQVCVDVSWFNPTRQLNTIQALTPRTICKITHSFATLVISLT